MTVSVWSEPASLVAKEHCADEKNHEYCSTKFDRSVEAEDEHTSNERDQASDEHPSTGTQPSHLSLPGHVI